MAFLVRPGRKASLSIFSACRQRLHNTRSPFLDRSFCTTIPRSAITDATITNTNETGSSPGESTQNDTQSMRESYIRHLMGERKTSGVTESDSTASLLRNSNSDNNKRTDMHHLYVYTTKHNTHLTLMTPEQKCIISISTGNIGFKKAARGTYDAAYQLTAYLFGQIHGRPEWDRQIQKLEVIMRGFGIGREAVTKAILGTEGRMLRGRIVRVSDATRLKFGGTRSPKPRRLG